MDKATGLAVAGLACAAMRLAAQDGAPGAGGVPGLTVRDIDGEEISLSRYRGQVLLVVNVASRCGFTRQYSDLEALYQQFREQGLVVLGFPSNDFGRQEPGSDAEIKAFCTGTFGISFPMFSKIRIQGPDPHPLYEWLTDRERHPEFGGPVAWNFTKFLLDREGRLVARFGSRVAPLDAKLVSAVEHALRTEPSAATP